MPILLVAAIVLLIISDQAVKYWAVHYLKEKGSIRFIHFGDFKILDLTYLENDGAMFVGGRVLLGTNVFVLNKFLEPYLQIAWQPGIVIHDGIH